MSIETDQTLATYLRLWFRRNRKRWAPATCAMYEGLIELHLLPALGRRKLSSLTPDDVKNWNERLERRHVTPAIRRRAQQLAAQAMQPLVDGGVIGRNVFRIAPITEMPKPDVQTLTTEQLRRLLSHTDDPQTRAMILLASSAMLRIGEIIGLRIADVNLKERFVVVPASVSRKPKHGSPEELRSFQRLPLPPVTIKAIETYVKTRSHIKSTQLLFSGASGKVLNRHNFRNRVWLALLERAGLPTDTHFDALRYAGRSMLLKAGVPASLVAKQSRLKDIRMVVERHGSVDGQLNEVIQATDHIFRSVSDGAKSRRER
jgi:integrase